MSFSKERSSTEEKFGDQVADFDIEAGSRTERTQIPYGRHSQSIFNHIDESSPLVKILGYPTPNSLKINTTSWLNGVRGVAALLVYVFHAFGCWFPLVPAWHADTSQNNILQLPLLRTVFVSGGAAVSVFFALSGYVLTHKSLRWIRESSRSKVQPAVVSSMFRRGFRLYLPPILLTFCEMLATRWEYPPPLNFTFVAETSFAKQFLDWIVETNRFVNPIYNFRAISGVYKHPKYDPVIWTIPLEFYGSFMCYILLLALMRVSNNSARMGLVAVSSACCLLAGSWNLFCFSAGMLIADFNLGQEEDGITSSLKSSTYGKVWTAIFSVSLYVAGFPTLGNEEATTNPMPGFETIRSLTPMSLGLEDHSRFWWSISGVSILLSISQLPRLKSAFETSFCQYLARISFSLYLVHEFCIVLFGLTLQAFVLRVAGLEPKSNTFSYYIVCGIWFLVFSVPVLTLASQVEKWVDSPSVKFAKWLEEKCLSGYRSTQ
jgi:peptidoglycan/LPS O-acetylase OafA/YrhL